MSSLAANLEHVGWVLLGAVGCYLHLKWRGRKAKQAEALAGKSMLENARRESEAILQQAKLEASQEALKAHELAEAALAARRAERLELERRLAEREKLINSQLTHVLEAEHKLGEEETAFQIRASNLAKQEQQLAVRQREEMDRLGQLSHMTPAEARETFLKRIEQDSRREANSLNRQILDEARVSAEEKARRIIGLAIQRYAGEHTFQNTTATVTLPGGEEIKGRIIGREGRNIRAFEAATGVTVLIDDTPGTVLLSGFDPVRREVARESMHRLVTDGRIHPTRIEEIVGEVSAQMDENITRLGEEAVTKTGLPPMAPEVVKMLGRLHFRHSFSQNILDHSIEVAQLMGLMAAELGLDVSTARRIGLLHDIGKAVSQDMEGPHAVAGAEFIKRHGESEEVVNAVAAHHNDVPPQGPLAELISAADAISASRPGARSETMTTYLKRIKELEQTALSFAGVEKAFAVQAGRELRVFVQPDKVDDEQAYSMARGIAAKIQNDLQYPGQIKVVVIRETRCLEVAK